MRKTNDKKKHYGVAAFIDLKKKQLEFAMGRVFSKTLQELTNARC